MFRFEIRVPTGTRPVPLGTRLAVFASLLALIPGPATALAQESASPAPAPEPKTTLPDVEDEVMCVVCGTTLELASENKQANDVRNQIRGLIAQGLTKDEIKDQLVAEFGPEVLAEPSTEGFDLAAWVVPGLAVVVAASAIFVGLRRWRSSTLAAPEPATAAESDTDRERLDADLKRYEL